MVETASFGQRAPRALLGITGSIAAYKGVEVARGLTQAGFDVRVIMTPSATRFVAPLSFEAVTGGPVLSSVFDEGQAIAHVEWAYWADVAIIAPATAALIARMAMGLADGPITTVLLSLRAPTLIAPAMESRMWTHPATAEHVETLKSRGVHFVGPVSGPLASGRTGSGRMAAPEDVVAEAERLLRGRGALAGRQILITGGPTWEPIDPVRFLSNRSTGRMAIAIAEAAALRGAEVHLVLGPTHLSPRALPGLKLTRVETAEEMAGAVAAHPGPLDAFWSAAAVSDFRVAEPSPQKRKRKDAEADVLRLTVNRDILAWVAKERSPRPDLVVGFAAETHDVLDYAREKRAKKGCDAIVANRVGPDAGFGPGQTEVTVVGPEDAVDTFGPGDKADVAEFLLDRLMPASDKVS